MMAEQDRGLSREELEQTEGEPLPAREVMSIVTAKPGVIPIPTDPTLPPDDPNPND
jgi:hypothetical protein